MFWHNVTYIVNSFVFSLDIPVIFYILHEIVKILHQKMINVKYLDWFHNDASEKNNSLSGHSNEPRING